MIQSDIVVFPDMVNRVACIFMNAFTVTNPLLNILFSSDNGFVFAHAMVAYSILVITIILNILVFLLVRSAKKIDSFRYVFYIYSVTNIIFSMMFSITLMQWDKSPGLIIFFPTGPFAHNATIAPFVFRVNSNRGTTIKYWNISFKTSYFSL
ncbi:hypothetical protein PMAYCL1PPCAC_22864 [Pristionchus mayeri]|uniref:G protein-coupled receptor n=1 Tax=Pristionchus mayeri TaxID=1317129 RepID=A0AAN5CY93_9BILA|nr:hypothetical protein PMAYCL1PPCAC_22864 [Pristionchus mayeri]